ncbi:MAG: hypothetical protein ACK445_03110 [Bacteroidota bacterium]
MLVGNDAFFGDSISSTVRAASNIYNNNLQSIFYPLQHVPGHPTLSAWLLAACWLLFGKSLLVAHAFACLWAFITGCIFISLSKHLLSPFMQWCAIFMLCCFATYISQSAMMLNTMAFMGMVLLAFKGFVQKQKVWQITGLILMMCLHTQSVFFLIGFFIAFVIEKLIIQKQELKVLVKQSLPLFALPALVYIAWLLLHMQHSGWAVQSPNYSDAKEVNLSTTFFKSFLISCWRLLDYGMLPVYMLLLCLWLFRKKPYQPAFFYFSVLLLVNMVCISLFLKNTIGHRYFLVLHMIAFLLLSFQLQTLVRKWKYAIIVLCLFAILAGNFLYYPGKTLGDATLAYRSYFELEKTVSHDLVDTVPVYSYAPVANEPEMKSLNSDALRIQRITQAQLDNYPAVLVSNVNAEFTSQQLAVLQTWPGNSYEQGVVHITVYYNPRYFNARPEWKLRTESPAEVWMKEMKNRFK